MNEARAGFYEFGPFHLDPLKRTLRRGAEPVLLTSRAFDTLLMLVQNAGRPVAKEELIERVWGSTVVEENNLTQCISALRKALGETRGDHRFIVTLPGRGYQFVAEVEERRAESTRARLLERPAAQSELQTENSQSEIPNRNSRLFKNTRRTKRDVATALWLAAMVAVVAGFLLAERYRAARGSEPVDEPAAGEQHRRVIAPGVNTEAYEAYLRGLYFFNRRDVGDIEKGGANFREAMSRAPGFALAYAGLADCYTLLALDGADAERLGAQANAAALKAVALDESLAEGHTALGAAKALFDWDWAGAAREFQRAIRANPGYALAHHWNAMFCLAPQGRYDEAIAEMTRAHKLDPVSLIIITDVGWAYFIAGRYDDAFLQYQKTLELDPRFVPAHFRLSEYYFAKGMYPESIRELELDLQYSGRTGEAAAMDREYQAGGYRRVLSAAPQDLSAALAHSPQNLAGAARLFALFGRREDAIGCLAALCDRHDPSLLYVKVDPLFASLRPDPRFRALERRMGLAREQ